MSMPEYSIHGRYGKYWLDFVENNINEKNNTDHYTVS